ncbi:MAG TPA: rhomboid family intramembrane serine protease [Myxococcota bacterium]|nr:rhomboid family intramembrane serine protease [Myxococcota bacterium]
MPEASDSGADSRILADSRRAAESISLVLAAEGIRHQVQSDDGAWQVLLAASDRARADAALESWARENAPPPEPPPEPEPEVETRAGLWLAAAILAGWWYTGDWSDASPIFGAGANDARLVLGGEWWRCVTALTLHSDVTHAAGNAFSCAVFASLLFRRYGPGVGGAILLASGLVGNGLAAAWHGAHYRSLGASTALFGAIGALAATELVRRQRIRLRASRVWLPLAGGLGLLAMLGTGRGSDLAAHVFGLAAGAGVGFVAARAAPRPLGGPAQWAFGAVSVAFVALCWRLALANP